MDIPVKKLARLLRPDQPPEVRAAAVLVLGELGTRDPEVLSELAARLDDESEAVRVNAILAVGKLKAEKALPALLERITHGGQEANLAAEAAAKLGSKAVKALQDLMPKVAPGLRRYIAAALTTTGTSAGDAAGVAVLTDADPQVATAAATAIIGKIPSLDGAKRKALANELITLASDKRRPLSPAKEWPVIRVLAALNEPASADILWACVLPPHTHEVRCVALQAVGKWVEKPTKDQWSKLFACAIDPDFRIAAPALMVLQRLPVSDKQLGDWVKLFEAGDVAARRLAVEKLGDRDTATVAAGLAAQLTHHDRGLSDSARSCLGTLSSGRKLLTDALLAAATADEAWKLARAIAPFAREFSAELRREVFDRACEHLEVNDHRADALLYLLREADPTTLREQLFERAVALRKKKKYSAAMTYLKALARDPTIGFPVRLELALCGLKTSGKSLESADRAGDPCLRSLLTLLDQDAGQLFKEIEKAKWLEPEELFYIGFHFAEQHGRGRQFGADVLRLVLKRSPKGELAKSAKNKLKSAGLA